MPEGKIMKALSGFYYVISNNKIYQCRGRGVFRKRNITPLVGDLVEFVFENEQEGYILDIKDRKNELVRPPISNVDQALLVFSAKEPDFNLGLLDRFLVMIEANDIEPIIIITKMDLLTNEEWKEINTNANDYRSIGYKVFLTSAKTLEGIDGIFPILKDKTSVLAGQSGVGKSTILNALNPELNLETSEISTSLGRGKHTTRHVELLEIGEGLIADTPGFSSLDFPDSIEPEELSYYFPEMKERIQECKFRGCLHLKEPGCSVKDAVEKGEILLSRYEHYQNFINEIRERKSRFYK